MRGHVERQGTMFVGFDLESRVPSGHPLRTVKAWCDRVLAAMSRGFDRAYGDCGPKGIPPESLIKCLLLRALFAIPSERRLCEACEFNLLYRWFIDWPLERPMWTPEAFSMNRDRFELHDLVRQFFDRLVAEGIIRGLVGDERFNVDGALIRSLAGHKSLKAIDGSEDDDDRNSWGEFKGKKRSNATHRSVVDPDARLMRKGGGEAHPSHSLHVLTDSESGFCVSVSVDRADGRAERENAIRLLDRVERRHGLRPRVVAADAGYGTGDFLCAAEERGITPHAAMPKTKIAGGSDRHAARRRMRRRQRSAEYRLSQKLRRLIEPTIGWCKQVGGLSRTRFIGHERIEADALLVGAAWNLLRIVRLTGAT